jgi:hypothetical protein
VNSNDQLAVHLGMTVLYVLVAVVGSVAIIVLAWLPGARARARSHSAAKLIAALGWCSMLLWPLWPVAMIWASSRRYNVSRPAVRIRVSPSRVKVARIA